MVTPNGEKLGGYGILEERRDAEKSSTLMVVDAYFYVILWQRRIS